MLKKDLFHGMRQISLRSNLCQDLKTVRIPSHKDRVKVPPLILKEKFFVPHNPRNLYPKKMKSETVPVEHELRIKVEEAPRQLTRNLPPIISR